MINIARIEAIKLQETIDLDLSHDGIIYRFRVIVNENPERKSVVDIEFRDKYEVVIQPSVEKKLRKYIKNYFQEEGK